MKNKEKIKLIKESMTPNKMVIEKMYFDKELVNHVKRMIRAQKHTIMLLKRDNEKKLNYIGEDAYCPICDEKFSTNNIPNFCRNCGQKIKKEN